MAETWITWCQWQSVCCPKKSLEVWVPILDRFKIFQKCFLWGNSQGVPIIGRVNRVTVQTFSGEVCWDMWGWNNIGMGSDQKHTAHPRLFMLSLNASKFRRGSIHASDQSYPSLMSWHCLEPLKKRLPHGHGAACQLGCSRSVLFCSRSVLFCGPFRMEKVHWDDPCG